MSRDDREVPLADAPKVLLPLRAGQLVGGLNLGHEPIGHQIEQLVLIADVVVSARVDQPGAQAGLCPTCGHANPPDANFCLQCGHNFSASRAQPAAGTPPSQPAATGSVFKS